MIDLSHLIEKMAREYNKHVESLIETLPPRDILCVHRALDFPGENKVTHRISWHILKLGQLCDTPADKEQYMKKDDNDPAS